MVGLEKPRKLILDYIEDVLVGAGLLLIVGTTLAVNLVAGCYVLGLALMGIGFYLARHPPGGR